MRTLALIALLAAVALTGCSRWVGYAVGDSTDNANSHAVADSIPDDAPFAYLGDVYETGTLAEFQTNFQDAWLQHRDNGYPTPGDHDWPNHSTGYHVWWGNRARHSNTGGDWYVAGEEAGWTIISLNTNESMAVGSPQWMWLTYILRSSPGNCAAIFTHHGLFGFAHRDWPELQPAWDAMEGRAILWINGNDHVQAEWKYDGQGITQLTSGAGGQTLYGPRSDITAAYLAWYQNTEWGPLKMTFSTGRVDWQFLDTAGGVNRSGSRTCTPRSG